MLPNWIEKVTADDLPEEFGGLIEKIGILNTLAVIEYFEGARQYFPKLDYALKHVRDKTIRREWKKHNIHDLAKKYNLTNEQIRNIVYDHEDQLDLPLT